MMQYFFFPLKYAGAIPGPPLCRRQSRPDRMTDAGADGWQQQCVGGRPARDQNLVVRRTLVLSRCRRIPQLDIRRLAVRQGLEFPAFSQLFDFIAATDAFLIDKDLQDQRYYCTEIV